MNLSSEDRVIGCIIGGALGDSIGAESEGASRRTSILPSQLFVTDDTQLTVATCEAIVETRAVSPESIAQSFARWFRERRITGIGASTLKSLTELEAGVHWAMAGSSGERSAGNGAAMRIAPLAFFLDPDIDSQRRTIRDVCRITHRNDEAYLGALAILRAIRHVSAGNELDFEFLSLLVHQLPDSNMRDRLSHCADGALTLDQYLDRFPATGYVVDSVPLSIVAAIGCSDFLATLQILVNRAADTDTIASMFGQIYGTARGTGSLPAEIVGRIVGIEAIREMAERLATTELANMT